MLSQPTMVVLGAGASFEFGLPVGSELAGSLRDALSLSIDERRAKSGDKNILDAYMGSHGPEGVGSFIQGANEIAAALPDFNSIDDCLHSHNSNKLGVLAGKMAIAAAIASAEQRSLIAPLWHPDEYVQHTARDTIRPLWPGILSRVLFTGLQRENYREAFNLLTIVSFNYDRCIESVLYKLVQSALNIGPNAAAEAMDGLKVYHPYGSLGPLKLDERDGVSFAPADLDLMDAANRLYVYTEPRDRPDDLVEMKADVARHQRFLFLGFGFHRQNIEILRSGGNLPAGRHAMGTVFRESPPSVDVFKTRLATMLGMNGGFHLLSATSTEFMGQYRNMLGA